MAGATPIEGEVLMIATVKGSVGPRVDVLVDRVQAHLGSNIDDYRRQYEAVHETAERVVFLAETGHWERVGDRLGLHEREVDAVRRAHTEQLEVIGRREGRESEFEAALEIRDPVVVATG
ncbi:MAG TPA: hypothetical protein VJ898_07835 [Natrialbaceae archaeon]|nr:hypothetical protein [Natrialbaceae archaeon]